MKKHVFGRQFNRDTHERKALFKGLVEALVMEESITTTEAKAKAIRGQVEKLITKAKRKGVDSKPLLQPWFHANAMEKVMSDLAVRFADRPGGYTRIIKLGNRFGDNAAMAVIELVEKREKIVVKAEDKKSKSSEKSEKVEATARSQSSEQAKVSKPAAKAKSSEKAKTEKKPAKKTARSQSSGQTKKGSK